MIRILTLIALLLVPNLVEARGFGGRSSFSSSRSFSSSSSRASSFSSKPRSSTKSAWGGSQKMSGSTRSTAPKRDPATQAKYEKAAKMGNAYSTKQQAVSAFKEKNASKYTSSYKSEPAKRPSHIPEKTTQGGTTYNVTYNQDRGGYGYWSGGGPGLGTWMMYNAMSDAAMLSVLMSRNNYYYDTQPMMGGHVVHHSDGSVGLFLFGFICFILICALFLGALSTWKL